MPDDQRKRDEPLPVENLPEQQPVEIDANDDFRDEAPVERIERRPGPRRRFPPVPEADVGDLDVAPPDVMDPRLNPSAAATPAITLVRNSVLTSAASNNSTSTVDEPSVASNGNLVFYTGNWFAAVSIDGGATFRYLNPYTTFPDPPGMRFCCDQVVQYIPSIDMFAWLLQYTEAANGENVLRLAFATTADVRNRRFKIFDINPRPLGSPNCMLDFPDMAVGQNMLYITTNAFRGNQWTASYVVRVPLRQLVTGPISAQRAVSTRNFAFRVAQNCATRAYWASHDNSATLRVFTWDESAARPTSVPVGVSPWSTSGFSSRTPDNFDWLGRCDPRVLGAAFTGAEVWFSWGSGRAPGQQQAHTRIVRLSAANLQVLQNIALASPTYAIQYNTLAVNSANEVGAAYMYGGQTIFPSHAVGILTGAPLHARTAAGKHGPDRQMWGDYLAVRRHHPDGLVFAASGYTMETSTSDSGVAPRFVLFRR